MKGSIWTLAGQVAPLLVSLVATPFTIRLLGSEAYGVLILIGLIPMYFSFADFGMSVASTKFAASAFGEGDSKGEAQIVRTAGLIALLSSSIVAIPLLLFSQRVIQAFKVPAQFENEASIALKLASLAFVLGVLSSVFNSPMLARLRMDLNQVTVSVPKMLLAGMTPIILFFGGGIVGAVGWSFLVALVALLATIYFSGRLLPELFRRGISREHFAPILRLGGAVMIAATAGLLLGNLEKLILTRFVSVKALAFYTVAFVFANTATFFSQAMLQSLVPAFSQLATPERKDLFNNLYQITLRMTILWSLPALVFLMVVAEPFFTFWAGPEFGRQSTVPLYLLLVGLQFSLVSFVPVASIFGFGRNDLLAKLYWAELPIYTILLLVLVPNFGIIGAAISWSGRMMLDSLIVMFIAKSVTSANFRAASLFPALAIALTSLAPPVFYLMLVGSRGLTLMAITLISLFLYATVVWKWLLTSDEQVWIHSRVSRFFKFRST